MLDKLEKHCDDHKAHKVLNQDVEEGELDLDVSSQGVVDEFNLLVSIKYLVLANQPLVFRDKHISYL